MDEIQSEEAHLTRRFADSTRNAPRPIRSASTLWGLRRTSEESAEYSQRVVLLLARSRRLRKRASMQCEQAAGAIAGPRGSAAQLIAARRQK